MNSNAKSLAFKAPLILSILAGDKTQTRRVIKAQPSPLAVAAAMTHAPGLTVHGNFWWKDDDGLDINIVGNPFRCPYGVPGSALWVREAYRLPASLDALSPKAVEQKCLDAGYAAPWCPTFYIADGHRSGKWHDFEAPGSTPATPGKYRPPMFMPRWASRISLDILDVKVERLNDISEADALAEGITCENVIIGTSYAAGHNEITADRFYYEGCGRDEGFETAAGAFADLWESINGEGSWDANPWVFVIEFKRTAP